MIVTPEARFSSNKNNSGWSVALFAGQLLARVLSQNLEEGRGGVRKGCLAPVCDPKRAHVRQIGDGNALESAAF